MAVFCFVAWVAVDLFPNVARMAELYTNEAWMAVELFPNVAARSDPNVAWIAERNPNVAWLADDLFPYVARMAELYTNVAWMAKAF